MKRGFGSIILILLALAGGTLIGVFLLRSPSQSAPVRQEARPLVMIEGVQDPVVVTLAASAAVRERGLSGTAGLGESEGMLFLFEYPGRMAFWMKDMRFPIDIIWIGSDWKVVDITHDLAPETYPQTFSPLSDAQYVLEVNAGFAERHGIAVGRSVLLKK